MFVNLRFAVTINHINEKIFGGIYMFNYVLKRMYEEYSVIRSNDSIDFLENGKVVATLYPKEQVINIFLSASPNVVWNHYNLAIFVIAKKYAVLNNGRIRETEAAWLIGCCGATWERNLEVPMYLGYGKCFKTEDVSAISRCYRGKNKNIRFNLFELEIEWKETEPEQPYSYSHINYLNPALVYPVKHGGKKVHRAKAYLRKRYDWEYGAGFNTAGSLQTREFIDTQANKVNHTKWSHISYYRRV